MAHVLTIPGVAAKDWALCTDEESVTKAIAVFENREALDDDYGRLLERAFVKVLASPSGLDPFSMTGCILKQAA